MFIVLCCAALIVGALIGTVGVGGILLIPAIAILANCSTHVAMATALFSFVFTGIAGTLLYQRHGSIDWRITIPVCIGSLIFGYFGAIANAYAKASVLNVLLGAIIIFAGIYALFPAKERNNSYSRTGRFLLLSGIGAVVGFGSGLTGVGGPVLSVPIMVVLGFNPLTAIATSQVIQIPAALSGSIGNALNHVIDYNLAIWISVFELIGVFAGSYIAHKVSTTVLRRVVAFVCIIVGAFVFIRALF